MYDVTTLPLISCSETVCCQIFASYGFKIDFDKKNHWPENTLEPLLWLKSPGQRRQSRHIIVL